MVIKDVAGVAPSPISNSHMVSPRKKADTTLVVRMKKLFYADASLMVIYLQ